MICEFVKKCVQLCPKICRKIVPRSFVNPSPVFECFAVSGSMYIRRKTVLDSWTGTEETTYSELCRSGRMLYFAQSRLVILSLYLPLAEEAVDWSLHVLCAMVGSESYAQLLVEGGLTCKYATTFNTDTDFSTLLTNICCTAHFTGHSQLTYLLTLSQSPLCTENTFMDGGKQATQMEYLVQITVYGHGYSSWH